MTLAETKVAELHDLNSLMEEGKAGPVRPKDWRRYGDDVIMSESDVIIFLFFSNAV